MCYFELPTNFRNFFFSISVLSCSRYSFAKLKFHVLSLAGFRHVLIYQKVYYAFLHRIMLCIKED